MYDSDGVFPRSQQNLITTQFSIGAIAAITLLTLVSVNLKSCLIPFPACCSSVKLAVILLQQKMVKLAVNLLQQKTVKLAVNLLQQKTVKLAVNLLQQKMVKLAVNLLQQKTVKLAVNLLQ